MVCWTGVNVAKGLGGVLHSSMSPMSNACLAHQQACGRCSVKLSRGGVQESLEGVLGLHQENKLGREDNLAEADAQEKG